MRSKLAKRQISLAVALGVGALVAVVWLIARPDAAVAARLRTRAEKALANLAPATELGPDAHISFTGRVTLGPVALHLRNATGPTEVHIERVVITPVLTSLVSRHPRVDHVHLEGVTVDLGPSIAEARATIASYRAWRAERSTPAHDSKAPRELPTLSAASLELRLPALEDAIADERSMRITTLGAAANCDAGCHAGIKAVLESGGTITASVSRTRGETEVSSVIVDIRAADIGIASIPRVLIERLPVQLTHGQLDGSLLVGSELRDNQPTSIDVKIELVAKQLTIDARRLADEPITPPMVSAAAHLTYEAKDQRIVVDDTYVGLGSNPRLRIHLDGNVATQSPYAIAVRAHADNVPCEDLFAALPTALAPTDNEPHPRGDLVAWIDLQGPALELDKWTLTGDIDTQAAHGETLTGAEPLKATFTHEAVDEHGNIHPIVVGPANPDYVAITELPAHVVRAVTTSEDGGFFGHHGFDFAEIQNSLAQVVTEHKIRGGSTITQQLAKNLYLSHQRTYARKIREAFIALALESTLGKNRLLEIYLNIIEWGPGLYGIGPAARHYFGKSATDLEPKEAAFLASIIPNPVRYHGYYTRRELTDTWNVRVNDILDKMHVARVLDDDSHAMSIAAPVVFR